MYHCRHSDKKPLSKIGVTLNFVMLDFWVMKLREKGNNHKLRRN